MALAFVASGSFQSKTSQTSVSSTTNGTGTLAIGGLCIVSIGMDNLGAGGTSFSTNNVTSVTDSVGNTYTKVLENTSNSATPGAGETQAVFYSILTAAVNLATTTWTAAFTGSVPAKAVLVSLFSKTGTGLSIQFTAGIGGNATPPSLSGLDSAETYLFYGCEAIQNVGTATNTIDSGPTTAWPNATFKNGTTGGQTASNMLHLASYVIQSGVTSKSISRTGSGRINIISFVESATATVRRRTIIT